METLCKGPESGGLKILHSKVIPYFRGRGKIPFIHNILPLGQRLIIIFGFYFIVRNPGKILFMNGEGSKKSLCILT